MGEGGVTGNRKELLKEELALAKEQGSIERLNSETRIDALKFEIDAGKQRFAITEDFTKNLKEGGNISKEALDIVQDQVEKGGDLNDIQEALVKGGQTLKGETQEVLNKDLKRLGTLNQRLAAQKDELDNEAAITDFKKQQLGVERDLANLLSKNKSEAQSKSLEREATGRRLSIKGSQGPISPETQRAIEFKQKELGLNQELADLKLAAKNSAAELAKIDQDGLAVNDATLVAAKNLAKADQERLDALKPLIAAEKQLAKFRSEQSGFDRGMESLNTEILAFGDKLGNDIPKLFSDNLGTAMKDAISGAATLEEALLGAASNFAGTIADAFIDQAAKQATASLFGGGEGTSVLGAATGGAAGSSTTAAGGKTSGGISGFIGGLFGKGKKGASPGTTATNPLFFQDVGSIAGGAGGAKAESIEGALKEGLGGEGEAQKGFFGGLKDKFGDLFGGLKQGLGDIFGGLKQGLSGLFSGGAGGGVGGLFSSVLGGFGGIGKTIGSFFGFANGGKVGSTDTVPAMLTPGEFVVKKSAVDKYGTNFLSSLNNGVLPMQGFQNGGAITPVSSEIGNSNSSSSVTNNSDFSFKIEGESASQTDGESQGQDQRQFADKVRQAVTSVIQEESRMGGSLNYLRG